MKKYGLIKDNVYPESVISRTRKSVRCVLFNKANQIALLHIKCNDIFGKRDHYETPGGGVEDNEDLITALKREMLEETGFVIDDIIEIGEIDFDWNIVNLRTMSSFFTAIARKYVSISHTRYEKEIIDSIVWFSISEIHALYSVENANIGKLIHTRDYLMIKEALALRNIK